MGEFKFFLGLQIKQLKEGTFISQAKYIRGLLKKYNLEEVKAKMAHPSSLTWMRKVSSLTKLNIEA